MKRMTLDLSGAMITIDGTEHAVESGELEVKCEYLLSGDSAIREPASQSIEIDVDLWEPE